MKKLFTLFLAATLTLASTQTTVPAQASSSEQVEYFDDGSYVVIQVANTLPSHRPAPRAAIKTITRTKTAEYFNAENKVMWSISLKGTFTYGNGFAKCTKAEAIEKSNSDIWKLSNKTLSRNGNRATTSITAKQTKFGIVYNTIKRTLTLTCSKNGVVS